MHKLSPSVLESSLSAYDDVVMRTPGIDQFCSSSAWVVPAHQYLHGDRELLLFAGDDSFAFCARSDVGDGRRIVEPLECMWGLAASVVGSDPVRTARDFSGVLERHGADWDMWVVCGLLSESAMLATLASKLVDRYEVRMGPSTTRFIADLSGGVDSFLARRSRNFRKSLLRAEDRVSDAGVVFEDADVTTPAAVDESFERIMGVERRSWKGLEGVGIDNDTMGSFYRALMRRTLPLRSLRLVFARQGNDDVAYVLGVVLGQRYRGLQFSYSATSRDLSLGNVLQLREMRALAAEGVLEYDLGSEIPHRPYKVRWSDRVDRSPILLVLNS